MELTTATLPALVCMIEEVLTDFIGDDVEEEETDEEEDEDEEDGLIDNPFCVEFYPEGETPEYAYFATVKSARLFAQYALSEGINYTVFCDGNVVDEYKHEV